MEIYIQDKLDLEAFDIIHLHGYKGMRAPKIDKIIGVTLEQLREQASKANLYRPEVTVMRGRKEKLQAIPKQIEETTVKQAKSPLTITKVTASESKKD